MPPLPQPISPELMLDTFDNAKLRMNKVHFRAIALLLKQAGKADADNEIAECRRCCVAILNFEIKYPPKHAFFPSSPLPPGDEPEARDAEEEDAPAATVAPVSPPLPLPAGGGRGEGVTTTPPEAAAATVETPSPSARPVPASVLSVPSVPSPSPSDPSPTPVPDPNSPSHRLTVSPWGDHRLNPRQHPQTPHHLRLRQLPHPPHPKSPTNPPANSGPRA